MLPLFTVVLATLALPAQTDAPPANGTTPPTTPTTTTPTTTTTTTTTPATTVPATTTTTTTAPATPTTTTPATTAHDNRPTDTSIGVGVGWFFPGDVLSPNTASVRIAFPHLVTIEPFVDVSLNGFDQLAKVNAEDDASDSDTTTDTSGYSVAAGTDARIPLLSRGSLDLQVLVDGSARWDSAHTETKQLFGNPELGSTAKTDSGTLTLRAGYGVGIEWFFVDHIAVSADATNPLAVWSVTNSTTKTDFDDGVTTTTTAQTNDVSTWNVGAIFSPEVRVMFHIYF